MKTWSTMEDYFRALERCLDCPGEDQERCLAQARRMADDFVQGKPDATPDEVAGCLGWKSNCRSNAVCHLWI